jgi:hypothetical protein
MTNCSPPPVLAAYRAALSLASLLAFAQQRVESLAPMLNPPDGVNERADRHGYGRDLNPVNKRASMVHEAVPSVFRQS